MSSFHFASYSLGVLLGFISGYTFGVGGF